MSRLDVTDHDHLALGDHLAVDGAGVVGGPLAAPAQRLDLEHVHPVGELDEPARALEQLVRKSVRMPKANTSICSSSTILASWSIWVRGVELGLVADQVVDPGTVR